MWKFVALALLTTLSLAESPPPQKAKPESLRKVASRIGAALLKQDWATFRRDATPYFTIEEHWRAYESHFAKGEQPRPLLGETVYKTVSFSTCVANVARLPKHERSLFIAFCKEAKNACEYHSDGWGTWPTLTPEFGLHTFDSLNVSGPCISSTVASNEDLVIEMVQRDGKWKAHRLMIIGH